MRSRPKFARRSLLRAGILPRDLRRAGVGVLPQSTLLARVARSGEQWGAVGSSQEQSGAVGSSQEPWGAVRSSQEQWGAVGSSQEQSGAVASADLAVPESI